MVWNPHQMPCPSRLGTGAKRRADRPVCGMTVDPALAAAHRRYGGRDYSFCCTECAESFDADPKRHLVSERSP